MLQRWAAACSGCGAAPQTRSPKPGAAIHPAAPNPEPQTRSCHPPCCPKPRAPNPELPSTLLLQTWSPKLRATGRPAAARPDRQHKAVFKGWCRTSLHLPPFPGARLGVLACGAQYKHTLTRAQRWLACSIQTAKRASFSEGSSPPRLLLDRSHVSSV